MDTLSPKGDTIPAAGLGLGSEDLRKWKWAPALKSGDALGVG